MSVHGSTAVGSEGPGPAPPLMAWSSVRRLSAAVSAASMPALAGGERVKAHRPIEQGHPHETVGSCDHGVFGAGQTDSDDRHATVRLGQSPQPSDVGIVPHRFGEHHDDGYPRTRGRPPFAAGTSTARPGHPVDRGGVRLGRRDRGGEVGDDLDLVTTLHCRHIVADHHEPQAVRQRRHGQGGRQQAKGVSRRGRLPDAQRPQRFEVDEQLGALQVAAQPDEGRAGRSDGSRVVGELGEGDGRGSSHRTWSRPGRHGAPRAAGRSSRISSPSARRRTARGRDSLPERPSCPANARRASSRRAMPSSSRRPPRPRRSRPRPGREARRSSGRWRRGGSGGGWRASGRRHPWPAASLRPARRGGPRSVRPPPLHRRPWRRPPARSLCSPRTDHWRARSAGHPRTTRWPARLSNRSASGWRPSSWWCTGRGRIRCSDHEGRDQLRLHHWRLGGGGRGRGRDRHGEVPAGE